MASVTIKIQNGVNNQAGNQNDYYAPNNQEQQASSGVGQTLKSVGAMKLVSAGTQACKSLINYSLANYGNLTGDYIGQQKINDTLNMINDLTGIGMSTASGAMVGGVPGAIIGLVVGAVSFGVGAVTSNITDNINIAKMNYVASVNADRLGRILVDGSR